MAVDRALLESVAAGAVPVLRLYRWSPATLSFGRNQPAAGLYDEVAATERGIAFVRRPTGGRGVLHDDELTYAVAAPVAALGRPRSAYALINRALVVGLGRLGLEAAVAGRSPSSGRGEPRRGDGPASGDRPGNGGRPAPGSMPDWTAACFASPAPGEVVSGGRKLVGSAQRTERWTVLQHGSILVGGSQAAAEELLRERRPGAPPGPSGTGWTTLEAELGRRPGWDELADAIVAGFREVLGIGLAPGPLTGDERERARRLETRFASRDWTWRR